MFKPFALSFPKAVAAKSFDSAKKIHSKREIKAFKANASDKPYV
jgi:hypothetical protein